MSALSRKRSFSRAGSWRNCAGCGRRFPRREVVRLVRGPEGDCLLDLPRKQAGRGLNLCWNPQCWQKAEQRGAATRRLGARLQAARLSRQLQGWLEEEFRRLWLICRQGSFLLLEPRAAERAAAAGRAALVLFGETGEGGRRELSFVPYRVVPGSLLDGCFGAREMAAAAVTHRGLARRLRLLLDRWARLQGFEQVVSEAKQDRESNGLTVDMTAGGVDYASVRGRRKG